jgi:hypothetical protein
MVQIVLIDCIWRCYASNGFGLHSQVHCRPSTQCPTYYLISLYLLNAERWTTHWIGPWVSKRRKRQPGQLRGCGKWVEYLLGGHLHHQSAAETNDRYAGNAGDADTSGRTAGRGRAKSGTKHRETTKSRRAEGSASFSPLIPSTNGKCTGQVDRGQLNCRRCGLSGPSYLQSDPINAVRESV